MKQYERHPISAAWPDIDEQTFAALREDIRANGVRDPLVLLDGKIMDGWHRYLVCQEFGIEFKCYTFQGKDPEAWVASKHLHRNVTATQRAAAVVKMFEWRKGAGRPNAAPGAELTTERLAEIAHTGTRTIEQAKVATEAGLHDAMREGKVSAKRAAQIAKLPEERRAAAIAEAKEKKPGTPKEKKPDARDKRIAELEKEVETLKLELSTAKIHEEEAHAHAQLIQASVDGEVEAAFNDLREKLRYMTKERDDWQRKHAGIVEREKVMARMLKQYRQKFGELDQRPALAVVEAEA